MSSTRSGLIEDTRLPLLTTVWDPARLLTFLRERAPSFLGEDVTALRLRHMTYRPARICVAAWEVESAQRGKRANGQRSEPEAAVGVTVTIAKDGRLAAAYRPGDPRAVYLADERCLIEAFPHDYELPALASAWERDGVIAMLRSAGYDLDATTLETPAVLAYRPHEASVLAYAGRTRDGAPLRLVAKVIRERERVAHFVAVTEALRAQLDAGVLNVPRAVSPDPNIVLMEHAPGVSLHEALAAADETGRSALAERIAAAMTALHRVQHADSPRPTRMLLGGITHTRARTVRLEYAAPALQARAEAILDRIEAMLPAGETPVVFLHGDLKGSQLLVGGGSIALIDLDSSGPGDPAVDAGNFLADLHREAVVVGATPSRAWATSLLEAVVAVESHDGLRERARLFQVVALVRMAVHAFRQQPFTAGRPDFAPDLLLDEAEACLRRL